MKLHMTVALILLAAAAGAQAQYKYIGADGKVVYSDQPPPPNAKVLGKNVAATGSSSGGGDIPFALQSAMKTYPVTLYTAPNCGGPCNDGRNLLKQRGIPFAEKTITTSEDSDKFQKAMGTNQLPVLTVGSSKQVQYSSDSWTSALNAAGYPATSQLPATYKYPAPVAVAPAAPAPTAAAPAATGATASAAPAPGPAPASAAAQPSWFKGF